MKLISSAEQAVINKDFGEIWNTKFARNTMILLPAIMAVFLPVMYLIMIYFIPSEKMNGIDEMLKLIPQELNYFTVQQSLFYIMINMVCPMFFLMIPLMSSSVSAACSFVGEKERGTIQTLLLTPLSLKSIFKSKVIGCTILSAISTAVSFVAFTAVISIGNIMLNMPFFLNLNWVVLVFILAPAVTVFGVIFMVLVSGKSKSYIESFQTSGYIVLPVIFLFIGQFTGLFYLNAVILFIISLVLVIVDYILWMFAVSSFTPEKLLK